MTRKMAFSAALLERVRHFVEEKGTGCRLEGVNGEPYYTDVSDEQWAFLAPYLTLMTPDAPQRKHDLREVFNALRYIVRAGCAWRLLPPSRGYPVSQPGKWCISRHNVGLLPGALGGCLRTSCMICECCCACPQTKSSNQLPSSSTPTR
jgi:hypothetical protein